MPVAYRALAGDGRLRRAPDDFADFLAGLERVKRVKSIRPNGALKVIQTFRETEEAASSGTGPVGSARGSGARWCTLYARRLTEALSRARV